MLKLVMTPPQNNCANNGLAVWNRHCRNTESSRRKPTRRRARELVDRDAAYGWVSPEALATARKLRWLQNPQAGPAPGYYYPELIAHPVVICNPRGIYFDHISHHILMFILALSRGLPYYVEAQKQRRWDKEARQSSYIDLADATALIVGVGGHWPRDGPAESAFGMTVLGIDPRPEYDIPGAEVHPTADLDALLPRADFVISTTPHTPETEGMWRTERFPAHEAHRLFHQRRAG